MISGLFCLMAASSIQYKRQEKERQDIMNGYVYVFQNGDGIVKIGRTKSPEKRKKTIESMSGGAATNYYITEICGNCSQIESITHNRLKNKRRYGEWFLCGFEDAVLLVKDVFQKHAIPPKDKLPSKIEMDELFEKVGLPTGKEYTYPGDKEAICRVERFLECKINLSYFNDELAWCLENNETEGYESIRKAYPKLAGGVEDAEEIQAYAISIYHDLKESGLCPFMG